MELDKFYVTDKELPFRITNTPFLGLTDLRDYCDGHTVKAITNIPGKVQFILMLNRPIAEANGKCLRLFAEAVTKHSEKALLHMVSVDGSLPILEEFTQSEYSVNVYRGDPKTNPSVHAMWEQLFQQHGW